MNNKMVGIAAIIAAAAMVITAVTTAVVNLLSFKWTVKAYEPVERLMKKAEPLLDKTMAASGKYIDEYLSEED